MDLNSVKTNLIMNLDELREELKDVEEALSRVETKIKKLGIENFRSPAFKVLIAEESELVKKKYRLERQIMELEKEKN